MCQCMPLRTQPVSGSRAMPTQAGLGTSDLEQLDG